MGPDIVIIKKGSLGSYILDTKQNLKVNVPAFSIDKVVDTTGAGDSFAGGFVGYLENNNIIDSVVVGSAIASFAVSAFGVEGLLNITKTEIEERIKHIKMEIKD